MTVPDPMLAPSIRWGILGAGGIARRFAREIPLYTSSTVVAVGSRQLDRAEGFVRELYGDGAPTRAYGSYAELVARPDIDAIYVASPHSEHHDHAILALEAGKPVLVEKAFTLNRAQAEDVFAVARRQGLFAMEAMWARQLPHYDALRQVIAGGELGEVQAIVGLHTQSLNLDPAWRMMNPALGGGALLDLGVYPLSLFHYLLGVPRTIRAAGILTASGVDLRETVICGWGDVQAVAYNDMAAPGRSTVQVMCAGGRIELPDPFYAPQNLIVTPLGGQPQTRATAVEGGFQYEAAEVARCLAAGRTESEVMTWQDSIEVMAMMDEVRRQLGVHYGVD